MRVHHLITKSRGGAAHATARIHAALLDAGVDSSVFFSSGEPRAAGWRREIGPPRKTARSRLLRLLVSLARRARTEQFTLPHCGVRAAIPAALADCDVLQLHWLGDHLLDLDRLSYAIPPDLPIVWRLADLNAITAACHYPGACRQYLEPAGCRRCPFLAPGLGHLLTRSSFAAKSRFLGRHPVHLVAISEWELDLARRSALGGLARSIRLIHNPFKPANDLAPPPRAEARRRLGLGPDARWICYGADNAGNARKGVDDFVAAVGLIRARRPDARFVVVGGGHDHPALRSLGPEVTLLGRLAPDRLDLALAASDVFAMPTREEALGQMGLEAISVGTPTVCYADSGPCSYVLPGLTGEQAPTREPAAFAESVLGVLADPARYSQAAVRAAYLEKLRDKFSTEGQVARYLSLYREITAGRPAAARA
jgi:glycosyltransferase involved in cell wall biosynthesis